MALTIVATVGSASANAFVTEAEQIAYMATRANSTAWTTVTGSVCTEAEKVAMVEAARDLSALAWEGLQVNTTQALAWPRQYVIDPDDPNGNAYATTVVPQRVKNAAMELAFQIVNAATDLLAQDPTAGIIQKTIGPLSTTYANPSQRATGLARYPSVTRFLRGLMAPWSGGVTSRLERA